MKKARIVSLAIGSAVAAASMAPLAQAADSPFSVQPLSAGYQLAQADKKADGKCGEAKCGADKRAAEKKKDGKCGEAKCGADKKADKKPEAACGAGKKKDASCGAAK